MARHEALAVARRDYTFMGDPPDQEFRDRPAASIGAGYRATETLTFSVLLDWRRALVKGNDDPLELYGHVIDQAGADAHQAVADRRQVLEPLIEFVGFASHEVSDVRAWAAARSLDRDDLLDLLQREAEPLRLPDERQQVQGIGAVHAVARFGPPRRVRAQRC